MIETITDLAEIRRRSSCGNIEPRRLELYLALARFAPGRLVQLVNERGYFLLCRADATMVGNPSTVVEHFFVYRLGADAPAQAPVALDDVEDLLGAAAADRPNVWLSFDNLAPNAHAHDTEDGWYNILPVAGRTYEAYLKALGSDRRRALTKALELTRDAHEERYTSPAAVAAEIERRIRAHCHARYGGDSLLEGALTREEILRAIDIFPTELRIFTGVADYGFVLACLIEGALYVMLVGGTTPLMIKRAYHSLIREAFDSGGGVRAVDAGSTSPFLKRQLGFEPRRFYAVLKGDPDWTHYVF
jgi:hypothetical protein